MRTEKERKEIGKRLELEISEWIQSGPNDTLSRLRKFYNSIISIHLGGDGIMERHRALMNRLSEDWDNETIPQEIKASWRDYKVNYPGKEGNKIIYKKVRLD